LPTRSEPSHQVKYLPNAINASTGVVRRLLSWVRITALILVASLPAGAQKPSSASLDAVIVAHQDDWQLFMGDVIARRVQSGAHVVFVYLTAGDDGRDAVYWATREKGVLQSTRIAAGVAAGDRSADHCSTVGILDHAIRKCTIANTESYFLRLPDGHRNGIGFSRHSFQSLRKLRQRRIPAMSAVDGSTVYCILFPVHDAHVRTPHYSAVE
jgi:GlcNAc-PI de-N-acetylase